MLRTKQNEDISPTLNPDVEDIGKRKKPTSDSYASTSRKLVNFKDRMLAHIKTPDPDLYPEMRAALPRRGHDNQRSGKSPAGIETDRLELRQTPERSMMDRNSDLRNQTSPAYGQTSEQGQISLSLLQEELRQAKDQVSRLEEESRQLRESQEDSDISWQRRLEEIEDLHFQQREQLRADIDRLVGENVRLLKELSEAREHLKRDNGYQALDKVYKALMYERRAQGRDGAVLKSSLALIHQESAAAQSEVEKLNQELLSHVDQMMSELQKRVEESEDKVAELQEEREKVAEERDRVRTQLNRVVQQLASHTSLDVYYFDDMYFKTQFSALRGNIKKWAHLAFSTGAFTSKRGISPKAYQILSSISSNWDSYMYSNEHRSTIVQAFVWAFLVTRTFGGRFWEPKSDAQPYGRLLERYLDPQEKQTEHSELYHAWRSTSARLAVPQGTEQKELDAASDVIRRTADLLLNYLEPWSTMGRTQSHKMLLKIIEEAVQLDLKMQQQRAYFTLWGGTELRNVKNGLYDPEIMEVRFGQVSSSRRHQYMELLIAPLLLKQGNSDGTDYSEFKTIEKAQVDIDIPSKKLRIK